MKRLVSLLVVAGVLAGITWAVRSLPWWALLLLFVALIVTGKFAIKGLLKRLILVPFKMKGAVLHNASVRVHSVVPSEAPTKAEGETEATEPDVPRRYFTLDVTIQPAEATGKFAHWAPGELMLNRFEFVFNPNAEESKEDDACQVKEVQYEEDGVFKADEGLKFAGPKRLKMTLAVREGVEKLRFQYYFEQFGEVQLPPNALRAAA
jgi:hypothetical protein